MSEKSVFSSASLPGIGPPVSLTSVVILSVGSKTLILAASKSKMLLQRRKERGLNLLFSQDLCFLFDNESHEAALPRSGMTNKALKMRTIRDH